MISDGSYKNYLAVASIKIDTNKRMTGAQDEGGFYSSALNLYQYQSGKVMMCLNEQLKRSITCLSSYQGKLVSVLPYKVYPGQNLVIWSYNDIELKLEVT